jgi:uncharacterized phage protein gp47/JayE
MPPNITLDYSGRDYTSNYEWLLSLLQEYVPQLTDLNASDAGISLLRLLARETDQLNLYLDQVFTEGFITSAQFYQSIIDLAKILDVLPKIPAAATTNVTVAWQTGLDRRPVITFPSGYQFYTTDMVPYCSMGQYTLPSNANSISIPVYQGTLTNLTVNPGDFSIKDLLGRPSFNLGSSVAARTISITSSDGNNIWTEVDSFYRSYPIDRNFRLELYADKYNGNTNTIFLVLGDGTYGASVPSTPMQVSFIATSGSLGNTGSGTINVINDSNNQLITCTNPLTASGGSDAEDKEAFRKRVPYVVQTQRRGVTLTDYQTLITSIPGVVDCQGIDRSLDLHVPHLFVSAWVLPSGGSPLSDELKSTIVNVLSERGTLGPWAGRYLVYDAIPVNVPVTCSIGVVSGFTPTLVVNAVNIALSNAFPVRQGILGSTVLFSDIFSVVDTVSGVSWVQFSTPNEDIPMGVGSYPVIGPISVTVST